jgi:uncharacterized protein YjbI with pentapeptide repeats
MASPEHVARLGQGAASWNAWRAQDPLIVPDLTELDLRYRMLAGFDLHSVRLDRSILTGADLREANLRGASLIATSFSGAYDRAPDLTGADLHGANGPGATFKFANLHRINLSYGSFPDAIFKSAQLDGARIRSANLRRADLRSVNFSDVDLSGSVLRESCLYGASFVGTCLDNADLTGCQVYGVSAWDVSLNQAIQHDLIVTHESQSEIAVDNLEVAQFVHLLLRGDRTRRAVDALTSKAALILGRFSPERKRILDAVRGELRHHGLVPLLFDFDKPSSRDITETVSLLAHLSMFVIADLTDARSAPQELGRIVPSLPSVPVLPIILSSEPEYGMFEHFTRFPWVMEVFRYADESHLVGNLRSGLISAARSRATELTSYDK